MSVSDDRASVVHELHQQIDELASRLALGGASPDLIADLGKLSQKARDFGFDLSAAGSALDAIGSEQQNAAELEELVSQVIGVLQQQVETDVRAEGMQEIRDVADANWPPSESTPLCQDAALVGEFIVEAREHLASIESQLLAIEQNPTEMDPIHSVFRAFHTIKGLAGFLEFEDIRQVAHEVETLLDMARNSKLIITPTVIDVVLAGADFLKEALTDVECSLSVNASRTLKEYGWLLSRISAAMTGNIPGSAPAPPELKQPQTNLARGDSKPAKAPDMQSVRVDTAKLDHLMDMVGEMVIAQSLIHHNQYLSRDQDARLHRDLSQLARITNEVQRTTMSMRMLPIGQLFARTARMVRDLSRRTGKLVELVTEGDDTEVDKTIAEELADPLMHMVRNAIDHGVESPELRKTSGKNPTAQIRLAAYHQGGQIVVEISDDGRGLDCDKILKKAREKGLVENHAQPSENEVFHLIFAPGFSTAEQVTDISGRGVGMDVVRGQIQKLRGRIEIQSKSGQGTTFFLKLPLTLAIIDGLAVVVGTHRYIVPIFAVREVIRPAAEILTTVNGKREMVTVRDHLLPVVRLHQRFGVQPRSENLCDGLLVVCECHDHHFCLLVDDLVGKQEVVIKNLGHLKNITGIAGGAILGDGRIGLILDMEGVFRGGYVA